MLTLALDTSTNHGSVAVWNGAEIVFSEEFTADRSHTSVLFAVLERARALGELGTIGVGLGPGSYAGVRIAIAAGIGLSLATGAKLVGLPSVAALRGGKYAAIGDARRGTFYWSVVDEGLCAEGPELVEEAGLRARLEQTALPVLASEPVPGFVAETVFPSAVLLARLTVKDGAVVQERDLEPIYLREAHITQPKGK